MGFLQGEGPTQGTLFPVVLDDLVRCDHVCRVIDAFVGRLEMSQLGFEGSEPAETGRPGYDPRDLLKLYLWLSAADPLLATIGSREAISYMPILLR
jgi:transposase